MKSIQRALRERKNRIYSTTTTFLSSDVYTVQSETEEIKTYARVTNVLSETSPESSSLKIWAIRNAMKSIQDDLHILTTVHIDELSSSASIRANYLEALCERARNKHSQIKNSSLNYGTEVHHAIEDAITPVKEKYQPLRLASDLSRASDDFSLRYILDPEKVIIPKEDSNEEEFKSRENLLEDKDNELKLLKVRKVEGALKGVKAWFDRYGDRIRILQKEKRVFNDTFSYGGTFDLLVSIDENLVMVDFKTSKKINRNYYVQLGAYILAYEEMFPNKKIDKGIVLRLPKKAEFLFDEHVLNREDIEKAKKEFLLRVQLYNKRKENERRLEEFK
eukprot:snap_masked-scaffold_8-processed-gene-7.50-mRNA-1 protein AED:1.00 eAED:1.00 QI:0/-1/0/0/-1/1/1/0/333